MSSVAMKCIFKEWKIEMGHKKKKLLLVIVKPYDEVVSSAVAYGLKMSCQQQVETPLFPNHIQLVDTSKAAAQDFLSKIFWNVQCCVYFVREWYALPCLVLNIRNWKFHKRAVTLDFMSKT